MIRNLLRWLSQLQILVFTLRKGRFVGEDRFGNKYYQEKKPFKVGKERRWVLYRGDPDASKIPPEWFGWMHKTMDAPLPENSPFHKDWIKPYKPNQTGTPGAYRPEGHILKGGKRAENSGDYQPWIPST